MSSQKKKFVLDDKIKNSLAVLILSYSGKSSKKAKKKLLNRLTFVSSKRGGRISVTDEITQSNFEFITDNKGGYKLSKTNALIYKSNLYSKKDFEKIKSEIIKEFTDIFESHVRDFYNSNKEYKTLRPGNIYLKNIKIKKSTLSFTVAFKEGLIGESTKGGLSINNIEDYKTNFPPLRFEFDKRELLKSARSVSLIRPAILNKMPKKDNIVIDFNKKMITMSNEALRWILLSEKNTKPRLEDILPKNQIEKIKLIDEILEEFKLYKEDNDRDITWSITNVSPNVGDISLSLSANCNFQGQNISARALYTVSDKRISIDGKTTLYDLIDEIDQEILSKKLKIEKRIDNLKNLFEEEPYFKNNELLLRAIIIFIHENKYCSETALFQFLRGRQMSDRYKLTEGYGAFKNINKDDIVEIIRTLSKFEVITSFMRQMYYSSYVAYKLNKNIEEGILNLVKFSNLKYIRKTNDAYYVKKCYNLKYFDEDNLDLLTQILSNEVATIYLKEKLKDIVGNSKEEIKKYIKTLATLEDDKKVKEALSYIVS